MAQTYTERFSALVTEIQQNVKARKHDEYMRFAYGGVGYDLADRTQRMALIERVTEDYVIAHADVNQAALDAWATKGTKSERPSPISLDTALIERLTDAVLDEELTDTHPDKVTNTEYPFMSEWQFDLRHNRETSLWVAENLGVDGQDHRPKKKRMRSKWEHSFMDRGVRVNNQARKAQYKRDTAAGRLVTYNVRDNGGELTEPFVDAAGQAARWREELALVYSA